MKKMIAMLLLMTAVSPAFAEEAAVSEPAWEKGISVYFNSEEAVQKGEEEAAKRAPGKADGEKTTERFQSVVAWDSTADGLFEEIKKQPEAVRSNGIWLVYNQPEESYSTEDKTQKTKLETLAKENNMPLSQRLSTGSPEEWERIL